MSTLTMESFGIDNSRQVSLSIVSGTIKVVSLEALRINTDPEASFFQSDENPETDGLLTHEAKCFVES